MRVNADPPAVRRFGSSLSSLGNMRKTLVIVYSYTGTGRRLAALFAKQQRWPVTEIVEQRRRAGKLGSLRCVLDQLLRRRPRIRYVGPRLEAFDSVVLIAPVWVGRLAAPMRSFVAEHADRLPELAFISVSGSAAPSTAAAEIAQLADRTPFVVAAFTAAEVADDRCAERAESIGAAIRDRHHAVARRSAAAHAAPT